MDYDKLITSEENTVITHVVYKEHTLGYLFRSGKSLRLGILHTSILKGSPLNGLASDVTILPCEIEYVREATQKDFDDYRVSSKGHLNENS